MSLCRSAILLLLLTCAPVAAFISNLTTILPVADDGGAFDRDTWNPTNGSFPAVGASYTDPIFGEVLTRVTNAYPATGTLLDSHNQWNADGTKFFWYNAGQVHVRTPSGTQVETNIPGGFGTTDNVQWSPFNADLYYYTSGDSLWQRNIATDTTTLVKDFNVTLIRVGSKGLWVTHHEADTANPTNLLFVINTAANGLQIWNQASDTLLTGSASFTGIRWAALSPDGKWLVTAATSGNDKYAIPVNVLTSTLGTGAASQIGTLFWSVCGDHGALVSATNGKNYLITGACSLERWHYRVDVSLDQTGRSQTLQAADNLRLFMTDAMGQTGNTHYSCPQQIGGAMQNWCWASNEDTNETAATPGTWYANKQEVMLINVLTGKAYRMAHHRSYPLLNQFGSQARVNTSQDGTQAFFMSGMGKGDVETIDGYSDVYHISGRHLAAEKPWSRRPVYRVQ